MKERTPTITHIKQRESRKTELYLTRNKILAKKSTYFPGMCLGNQIFGLGKPSCATETVLPKTQNPKSQNPIQPITIVSILFSVIPI